MAKNSSKQKVVIIVGPTASGKSGLAIKLARRYSGEIISADSRQVYRGMDIGTGKVRQDRTLPVPNLKFKNQNGKFKDFYSERIKHHLIDVANPKKQFTASDFKRQGEKAIKDITARGKIPIIAGGTGFYIDILIGRMATAEVPANPKLRNRLEKLSPERLFKLLSKLDPERAKTIDSHNPRRLIRAIEIFKATKKSSVPDPRLTINNPQFDILWLGLNPKNLDTKIKKRLDERLRHGMVGEVKRLLRQGISHKRLEALGLEYGWISRYLRGLISKDEMREKLYRDILRYSKRQMTWFKINKEIHWLKDTKEAESLLSGFLRS